MVKRRNLKFDAKHAREIAKAQVIGAEKGKLQVDKVKFNWNNIGLQVKKRLLELDPSTGTKLIATLGVAMAIKSGIDWSEEILRKGQLFSGFLATSFVPDFLGLDPIIKLGTETMVGEARKLDVALEIQQWLISFGLAYLIVDNFGEIVVALGTGLSSVVGLAKTLLGAGLVPV